MIHLTQLVTPLMRRAAVVGTAVILTGFAVLSQRPQRQVVTVSTSQRTQVFHVAADSPETDSLRKSLAREAIACQVRKPDEYYRAAWRLQAAAYYLQRSHHPSAAAETDQSSPQSVVQAAYQPSEPSVDLSSKGIAYWTEQYAIAEREFESVAARLPSSESETGTQPTVAFGPVVATATKPGEAFLLVLLALAAGWGYVRASRPRPAAILLQTHRKVVVKSEWLATDRPRPQQTLKRIDQTAWVCAVVALVTWG